MELILHSLSLKYIMHYVKMVKSAHFIIVFVAACNVLFKVHFIVFVTMCSVLFKAHYHLISCIICDHRQYTPLWM